MLKHFLHTPNVTLAKKFSSDARLSQVQTQIVTSGPSHTAALSSKSPLSPYARDAPQIASYPCAFANMKTEILPVDPARLGNIEFESTSHNLIDEWDIEYKPGKDFSHLQSAANELFNTETPVAFPTETVYGLGADATRSQAVRNIFAAKGRPADNPLIVHVHSLAQLRGLLSGKRTEVQADSMASDPIPDIYKPLISRFWPGPLTLIVPNPRNSVLAPEVTAGLSTFGARMPRSILSLALIRLAGVPLAGPSANASTRPSPTAAEHVFDDLQGRIHTIIDGGPCEVGVESTVVDGISGTPTILRPGGISVDQLRQCAGWENVSVGYKDAQERDNKPKAPGMKYRHYSPKARVVLFEAGAQTPTLEELISSGQTIGIIRTRTWPQTLGLSVENVRNGSLDVAMAQPNGSPLVDPDASQSTDPRLSNLLRSVLQHQVPHAEKFIHKSSAGLIEVYDISLGAKSELVARGLFSALRELDKKGVHAIYVEGIDDSTGDDIAAAVMNRLRKAAEIKHAT